VTNFSQHPFLSFGLHHHQDCAGEKQIGGGIPAPGFIIDEGVWPIPNISGRAGPGVYVNAKQAPDRRPTTSCGSHNEYFIFIFRLHREQTDN